MKEITLLVNQKKGHDDKRGRDKPFRTLSAAVSEAKRLLSGSEPVDLHIALSDHRYDVKETIVLTDGDFGNPASSISFFGASGRSLISGKREILGRDFVKVPDKPYYVYQLPEEERDGDGLFPAFRDFYCNGRRACLCRNDVDTHIPFPIPAENDRGSEKNKVPKLYIDKELLEGLETDVLPLTELWIKVEWQIHCIHIEKIERRDRREGYVAVHILPEEWELFVRSYCQSLTGRPCYLANNIAFLDKPNEFYYDRRNGRIYYYPESDYAMSRAVCAYPTVDAIFRLSGCRNVAFENIAFTGTTSNYVTENGYITGQCGRIKRKNLGFLTDAAIYGENCEAIRIDRCEFYETGADAVYFNKKTRGLTVSNSAFRNIGATAIRVGRADSKWDEEKNSSKDIIIENNLIDGTGLTYTSNVGVFIGKAEKVQICHNTIKNSCYSAISVGWSWSLTEYPNLTQVDISYNYIDNFMFGMRDGGAIYTLGGNAPAKTADYINFMHHNYMVVGPTCGQNSVGYRVMYHDQGSSHWHDFDNVILAREDTPPRTAFVIGGSLNNLIERTYILNYSLTEPMTVEKTDDPNEKRVSAIEEGTLRQIPIDAIPDAAASIIRSAGCSFCMATPPVCPTYAHSEVIHVSQSAGNDRHSGLTSPCKTLEKAMETLRDLLSSKRSVSVRIELDSGEYLIDKTLKMETKDVISEDHEIIFSAAENQHATIGGAARILLMIENGKSIRFRNLSFTGRNASVGSAILAFRNAKDISFSQCDFSRINANAVLFSGVTQGVSVTDCLFSHIGGAALRFGAGEKHSDVSGNTDITVKNCLFEYIGYVIAESPAIYADACKNFFVRQNSFRDLSYEAVHVGYGKGPVTYPFGHDYNVANAYVSGNFVSSYCMARGGAAIRVSGGNCTHFHHQPFNVIEKNYIRVGEKTGNATGEFMVFSHENAASQWHTRFNCILPHKANESYLPLCYFSTDPHAYAIWAEGNVLITDRSPIFIEPHAIADPKRDLHDKENRCTPISALGEAEKEIILCAGCADARPVLP